MKLTEEQISKKWSEAMADTEGMTHLPIQEFARAIEAAVLAQGEPTATDASACVTCIDKKVSSLRREFGDPIYEAKQEPVRVGHLQISRHQTSGIWLRHDSGEGMQTDEDKLYQHLSEYWNKEF